MFVNEAVCEELERKKDYETEMVTQIQNLDKWAFVTSVSMCEKQSDRYGDKERN